MKALVRHTVGYVTIGAVASVVDGSMYVLFTRFFSRPMFLSNFLSVNCGITTSFFLNSFFNFRKTSHLAKRALSFYGICYVGMCISMGMLFAGTHILGFQDIPVKIVSVMLAGIMQFTFNKLVTFGKIGADRPSR